jgi:hypothetical protein
MIAKPRNDCRFPHSRRLHRGGYAAGSSAVNANVRLDYICRTKYEKLRTNKENRRKYSS